MDSLRLVLDRPFSPARTWLQGILGLICWSPVPITVMICVLGLDRPLIDTIEGWAAVLPLSSKTATLGTVFLVVISPLLLQMGLLTKARHRYGWCELREDGATFQTVLRWSKGGKTEVAWGEVESWEAHEDVIVIRQRGRSRINRFFQPLVIPTTNEEEQQRIVARLFIWTARPFETDPSRE